MSLDFTYRAKHVRFYRMVDAMLTVFGAIVLVWSLSALAQMLGLAPELWLDEATAIDPRAGVRQPLTLLIGLLIAVGLILLKRPCDIAIDVIGMSGTRAPGRLDAERRLGRLLEPIYHLHHLLTIDPPASRNIVITGAFGVLCLLFAPSNPDPRLAQLGEVLALVGLPLALLVSLARPLIQTDNPFAHLPIYAIAQAMAAATLLTGLSLLGLAVLPAAVADGLWSNPAIALGVAVALFPATVLCLDPGLMPRAMVRNLRRHWWYHTHSTAHYDTVCAVHEAGHVLAYAARRHECPPFWVTIKSVPFLSLFTARVYGAAEDSMPSLMMGGAIACTDMNANDTSHEFLRWQMLQLLGGMAAEHLVFEESSIGTREDMAKWYHLACLLLAARAETPFHENPIDEVQRAHNARLLEQLYVENRDLAMEFARINRAVLEQIAQILRRQPVTESPALQPLLEQVILPEGYPCPHTLHVTTVAAAQ